MEKPEQAQPLPTKLTPELIQAYKDELAKLDELKAKCKPVSDRANALLDHIAELMAKTKKDVKIVGTHRLGYVEKSGSVSWKTELAKRVSSDELATIEKGVKTSKQLEIT